MGDDPLHEPLGLRPATSSRSMQGPIAVGLILGVALLGGAAVMILKGRAGDDQDRVAVAPIEPLKPPPAASAPAAPAPTTAPAPAPAGGISVTPDGDTVEVQNGVKIIRMGAGRAAKAALAMPSAPSASLGLQPVPDPDLIEHTAAGDLPRIGPDGRRPSAVYARPVTALSVGQAAAPRLAVMVGDLGGDPVQSGLADERLPPAVSLAFRPDGSDPMEAVSRAREAGHEVLLELPGSVPAWASGGDALDGLHRMMGRFSGYVGITAEVGGHFPGQPGTGALTLRDLAARGLLLIDNDAAPPDRVATAPPAAASPDVIIDGRMSADAISAAFGRLEDIARARGQALGYVGHPSGKLEAITAALAGAGERGFVLVPVSSIAKDASGREMQGAR